MTKKPQLTDIPGIGEKMKESLRNAGIKTVRSLSKADATKLSDKVDGLGLSSAESFIDAAKELVPKDEQEKDEAPSLKDISGVGPKTQTALKEAGYKTVEDIAITDPAELAERVDGVADATADQIVEAALELVPDEIKKKRKPRLSDISGVGPKTQEALRSAGYKTVSMIAEADPVQIADDVEGVGGATAETIVETAQSLIPTKKKPKKKKKKKAVKKKKKEPEIEFKGGKARHDKRLLRIAARKKKRKPKFKHEQAHRWNRVSDSWRKVRGIDSATREKKKGRPAMVSAGYRTPKEIRGLHPSGYEEVLVHRPADLEGLDPEVQAIRIGGTVGMKKRQDILDKADTMFLRVLNPGVPEEIIEEDLFEELEGLEDMEVE